MAEFLWEATTRNGERRSGQISGNGEEGVRERLRAQGLNITKLKRKPIKLQLPSLGSGVSLKDLVVFTRTFSTMIDAGLPIVQCLDMLSHQSDNRRFGDILGEVKSEVEGGKSLSEGMAKFPRVFDDLFRNLVAAGEAGGILDLIFRRLATYLEKSAALRRQVRGALVYPSAIFVVGTIVMAIMMTVVLPTFESMFKDLGAGSLPAITQFVLSLSHFVTGNAIALVIALIIASVTLTMMARNPNGRYLLDAALLQAPVVGPVVRKGAVARFTRTLGTLLASGVPILDAMDIVARTAGNKVISKGILHTRDRVSQGEDIATPLLETRIFPPMVVQMIGVGEQTGAMDEMLQKIADFYEDEVDAAVDTMTSMLEPIILVFLGVGVGGMLIAMYMPIFEIAGAIK
ncbi:MAG: type II secretion system F family protein [Nannocystaceae bacterium]